MRGVVPPVGQKPELKEEPIVNNFRIALTTSLLCAAALAPQVHAQNFLQQGEFVTAAGGRLGVMTATGATSATIALQVSISTILWDPNAPDSFIVGTGTNSANSGQLLRVTFVAPGQVVQTPIAPTGSFSKPLALCWDQAGTAVFTVTNYSQVHRINVQTGAVVDITNGTQPWNSTARALALDPATADVYVGCSNGELYRIGSGGSNPQLIASGLGSATELLIDSSGNRHNLFYVTATSMRRVDLDTLASPTPVFGTVGTPSNSGSINAACFDDHGDLVLYEDHRVLRVANPATIPLGGIAPTLVGTFNYPSNSFDSYHGAVVGGTTQSFRMVAETLSPLGAYLAVENVPTNTAFGFTFFSASTLLPQDTGPFFGLMPDSLTMLVLGLPATPAGLFSYAGNSPQPVVLPPLTMAVFAGQTWDFVSVAFAPNGQLEGRSNVVRVTWN